MSKIKSSETNEIKVGTGCTFLSYTDTSPGVVVEVLSPKKIMVASVRTETIPNPRSADGSYQIGDDIQYEYFPDLTKSGITYSLRKNGMWIRQGQSIQGGCGLLAVGYMRKYRDPSF